MMKTILLAVMAVSMLEPAGIAFAADPAGGSDDPAHGDARHADSYDSNDPCYFGTDCYSVVVGSASIDASRLAPYHASWTQSVPDDGDWVLSPATFEERLEIAADGHWTHTQIIRPGDGSRIIGTRLLDRWTLQILDVTLQLEGRPPDQPVEIHYDLRGETFAAESTMHDGSKQTGEPRELFLPMFDGQIAGVTLAALPLDEGYVATLPMVIPNLGFYWLEASVVGLTDLRVAGGGSVRVWEVAANWLNLSDGDVYPGGRDESGGVYYIAVQPGNGVPPVVEYANNGAVIAWDGHRVIDQGS